MLYVRTFDHRSGEMKEHKCIAVGIGHRHEELALVFEHKDGAEREAVLVLGPGQWTDVSIGRDWSKDK